MQLVQKKNHPTHASFLPSHKDSGIRVSRDHVKLSGDIGQFSFVFFRIRVYKASVDDFCCCFCSRTKKDSGFLNNHIFYGVFQEKENVAHRVEQQVHRFPVFLFQFFQLWTAIGSVDFVVFTRRYTQKNSHCFTVSYRFWRYETYFYCFRICFMCHSDSRKKKMVI